MGQIDEQIAVVRWFGSTGAGDTKGKREFLVTLLKLTVFITVENLLDSGQPGGILDIDIGVEAITSSAPTEAFARTVDCDLLTTGRVGASQTRVTGGLAGVITVGSSFLAAL